ncbi:hypothetical protein [Nocardia nepalensis]|uniref:hypothetical protein n=1 Tax=Nocardia nepalensis TaxID=3375448 RepID=UPI003B670F28
MSDHRPPEVTVDAAEGNPLPRTQEFITQLTREYGAEYTMALARAVEFANRDDQVRYMSGLEEAIDILSRARGDESTAKALAIGNHVPSIIAAIHADLQACGHHGAIVPESLPPHDGSDRPGGTRRRLRRAPRS